MGYIVRLALNMDVMITPSIRTGMSRGLEFTCFGFPSSSNTAEKQRGPAVDVGAEDWALRQEKAVCW